MTARPQDVALLPLPECLADVIAYPRIYNASQMQAYARANVTAALASAQAREEELRAEVARLTADVNTLSRSVQEERTTGAVFVAAAHSAEARAERLAEALQQIADWKLPPTGETWPSGGEMSYEAQFGSNGARDYIRGVARAALSTNAAQPGETNEAAK